MTAVLNSIGNVLTEMAKTVSIDLAKRGILPPLLSMVRKEITDTNLLKWDINLPVGAAVAAAYDAPTLYPNFPVMPDNGVYSQDRYREGQMLIGANKVFSLMKLSDQDVLIAKSRGKASVQNIYQKSMTSTISRVASYLEAGIVNGNGFMQGFNQVFSGTSYGGLIHTLADYSTAVDGVDYFRFWRPYSANYSVGGLTVTGNDSAGVANPATVHSLASGSNLVDAFDTFDLQLMLKQRRYSAIVTTPEISVNYQSLYRKEASWTIQNGSVGSAELGVTNPTYRGRPIVSMMGLPANTVYFLDLSNIVLYTLAIDATMPMQDLEGTNYGGLAIGVGALAKDNAQTSRYEVYTVPQLVVEDMAALNRLVIIA